MDNSIVFESILDWIYKLYDLITTTSHTLFVWFSQPVNEGVLEMLELPLTTTNIDLMLGTFVPVMLVLTLTGAIFKALFP